MGIVVRQPATQPSGTISRVHLRIMITLQHNIAHKTVLKRVERNQTTKEEEKKTHRYRYSFMPFSVQFAMQHMVHVTWPSLKRNTIPWL